METYITGDTHGEFNNVANFCYRMKLGTGDKMIILGDAGINYYGPGNSHDDNIKCLLRDFGVTFFCIHGNHEMRPQTIPTYQTKIWNNGLVYYEPKYPNLLFAVDGQIYNIDGQKTFVCGGAYSVDKQYRILRGWNWWEDEQPSISTMHQCELSLSLENWDVDTVLTHTCPLKYEPTEVFIPGIDQSTVDKSTEAWLDKIEDRLKYKRWYCGHYHTEKTVDKLTFMYHSIKKWNE